MSGCHQILSGAVNPGDRAFSLGNIDGISFLAYASGCNLVILSFDFQRVQIIPGDVQISCVHCSSESGKIAAAYQNKIKIFEPTLSKDHDHPNPLFNYRWSEKSVLECDCRVNSLSWDEEGIRLLMGGTSLQMWKLSKSFVVMVGDTNHSDHPHGNVQWDCIWKCETATEVHFLSFSPDSRLFATAGKFDRLVKVWYPVPRYSPTPDKVYYDFVYLAHPRAVTGFSWRQTSKYMPKGSVYNALITSCVDKICRLWTETVLPEDEFSVNVNREHSSDAKFQRNHKHKIMKRLQHVKTCFHLKRHRHKDLQPNLNSAFPMTTGATSIPMLGIPSAHSIPSAMELISHAMIHHGVCVHFHLAASINAETDIPLVPPLKHHNFRIFWLNNKEMFFTQQAELIFQQICKSGIEREETGENIQEGSDEKQTFVKSPSVETNEESYQPSISSAASSNSLADGIFTPNMDVLDRKLETLLRDWHKTPDILVSLHPVDGSFLVWSVEWLDEYIGTFRQAQVSFSSCIPNAIPLADATSMSTPSLYLFPLEKLASNRAAMMTKHHNGSLNLWTLSFGDDSKFCQVLSVAHSKRASGHRFKVREMACHPVLPLILTAASHGIPDDSGLDEPAGDSPHKQQLQNYCSELILWRVDPIGPLCKSGGIVEISRINSTDMDAFSHVAWVPGLLPSTSLFSNSGCFVASDGTNLRVYQAILDASELLTEISTACRKRKASFNDSVVSLSSSSSLSSLHGDVNNAEESDIFAIVSQQSTSRPGCILQLDRIDNQNWGEVSFIQVFRDDLEPCKRIGLDYSESFHVVVIVDQHQVHVWRIEVSTPAPFAEGFEENRPPFSQPRSHTNSTSNPEDPTNNPNTDFPSLTSVTEKPCKKSFLNISITKVLQQTLCAGLSVTYSACTGHFVCGSSYALISTTKECVKMWKLLKNEKSTSSSSQNEYEVSFQEWNSLPAYKEKGQLMQASAAYSGRIACVYKLDGEKESVALNELSNGDEEIHCTCAVNVYQCESTGGMQWLLEDTIEIKIDEEVSTCHLEWVPKNDGQHILALAISDMLCMFAHVSHDPSMNLGMKTLPSTTICKSQFWLPLHTFKFSSADGLRPFPVRFGWVHAVCVVAMRNEMQVYSQWALENLTDVSSLYPTPKIEKERQLAAQDMNKPQIELSLLTGSVGLYQYTRHCYPVLPQYHPKQLIGMLNSGKVRWVKIILAHLVRCMAGSVAALKRQNTSPHDEEGRQRSYSISRALSVSYGHGQSSPSPLEHRNSVVLQPEDLSLSSSADTPRTIPPVPLWMLLNADKESGQPPVEEKTKDYNELFSTETEDETLDESVFDDLLDDEDDQLGGAETRKRRRSTSGEPQPLTFGTRQSRQLSKVLTRTQLPGLTSVDQMHLLALADTVSSIGTRLDHRETDTAQAHLHDGTPDSLDDCGLRFLLVVRNYNYLLRCLPPAQRIPLKKQGVSTSDIAWAFHSESQEDLLNLIPAYQKNEMTWALMRELGVGWWLRSNSAFKTCMEKIGKYAFQKNQDPMDAAIFFLAMKKKTLLWGLYRSKRDEKMALFFSNDFSQERWRKAALKNAYALLGKQRFEHAAAFFLLAGSLKDAVEVCLNKLKDIQLALSVARLYEGGDLDPTPPTVKSLLQEEVLNVSPSEENGERDPFLCSIALWMLKDYQASLDVLISSKVSARVFDFYVFLRSHPLLVLQNKTRGTLALTGIERRLYFETAHAHYASGCPILAIHVLTELPKYSKNEPLSALGSPVKSSKGLEKDLKIQSGTLFHDSELAHQNSFDVTDATAVASTKKESAMDFDWSAPVTKFEDDELKLDWDDGPAEDEDEDLTPSQPGLPNHTGAIIKDKKRSTASEDNDEKILEDDEDLNDPRTMVCIELKLSSCLKLMSEELVNLVGQLEGTELRLHLYAWLEKQVPMLKEWCRYVSDDDNLSPDEWNQRERSLTPRLDTQGTGLHDILLSEKLDLEWKMGVIFKRNRWLRANRHLLATLLAFARLHAHTLAPVYIELVFLLDELQKEKSSGSGPGLVSPLPFLHSEFPLLSAVANPTKTAVSIIQSSAQDILQTISELVAIPVIPSEDSIDATTAAVVQQSSTANVNERRLSKVDSLRSRSSVQQTTTGSLKNGDEGIAEETNEENNDDEKLTTDEPGSMKKSDENENESVLSNLSSKEEMSAVVCDWRLVLVLRDSAVSLSSCLFQALSDSETNDLEKNKDIGVQLLYSPRRRRYSSTSYSKDDMGDKITSPPEKWPGVAILRGMLSREEDGETPKLKYLLVECYVAVFVSIFVHAVAVCDSRTLYRLLAKKMDANAFASVFGGGTKRQIRISAMPALQQLHPQSQSQSISSEKDGGDTSPSTVWTTLASLNKARMKFNMKLLGQQFTVTSPRTTSAPTKEEKPTFREKFISPELAIHSYLISKPEPRMDEDDGKLIFLDTDDEEEDLEDDVEQEEEDYDDFWGKEKIPKVEENKTNEDDPFSYSWRLMRLAAVKLAKNELSRIVTIAGIESAELSHVSPFLDGVIRVLSVWQDRLFKELEAFAPAPFNFLKNSTVENLSGPPINKYRALLDHTNTPFPMKKETFSLRRLWNLLVRGDNVQDYFVRFIFGKKRAEDTLSLWEMSVDSRSLKKEDKEEEEVDDETIPMGPVRIVHKEHESISSFCVNQSGGGIMAISTPKEVQELDISVLLDMDSWKFEDQVELDLINLYKDPETLTNSSYLVVQSPSDRSILSPSDRPQKGSHSLIKGINFPGCTNPAFVHYVYERSRRFMIPILKHRVDGTRRMASHSSLPLYLSGGQDGSVRLWEFSHAQPVSIPRPPGTFAKVTRIRFNGNKFGVADGDGRLSLWQIGANNKPFYTVHCHSKQACDFVFLGSASLLATGGISSESKNVALWDTLMPMKKAQIASFTCHDQGCVALAYAEEHQSLISAGKKGAICIWDVRQRCLRHRFIGHEGAIKCMCLDPSEEYFCTGSADGDIKVWDFNGKPRAVFHGEHSRSGFFKNIPGQGVTQLSLDNQHRLFSCGADGSVKIRVLTEKYD